MKKYFMSFALIVAMLCACGVKNNEAADAMRQARLDSIRTEKLKRDSIDAAEREAHRQHQLKVHLRNLDWLLGEWNHKPYDVCRSGSWVNDTIGMVGKFVEDSTVYCVALYKTGEYSDYSIFDYIKFDIRDGRLELRDTVINIYGYSLYCESLDIDTLHLNSNGTLALTFDICHDHCAEGYGYQLDIYDLDKKRFVVEDVPTKLFWEEGKITETRASIAVDTTRNYAGMYNFKVKYDTDIINCASIADGYELDYSKCDTIHKIEVETYHFDKTEGIYMKDSI